MSQDLFAAFGGDDVASTRTTSTGGGLQNISSRNDESELESLGSTSGPISWTSQKVNETNSRQQEDFSSVEPPIDDDDDFGDFEDASVSVNQQPEIRSLNVVKEPKPAPPKPPPKDFPPKASPSKITKAPPPKVEEQKLEGVGRHPFANHMDLLFEAGDDEYDAGTDELGDLSNNPEAAMAYSKRIIAEQQQAQPKQTVNRAPVQTSSAPAPKPARNRLKKKSGYVPTKDPEVLFDAENVSEHDDDFGDFDQFDAQNDSASTAKISKPAQSRSSMPSIDLLGLDDVPVPAPSTTPSGAHISHSRTASTSNQIPIEPDPTDLEPEDDWDDFETAPAAQESWDTDFVASPPIVPQSQPRPNSISTTNEDKLPPTNVPPPAILLSLFPSIFAAADDALFNAVGKLELKQRQMLLAHPASHQFLKAYLGHCTVLARIIAGRRQRWKRDQHLSQSMRIGPSAAGGKGGMKLTGVDKTETAKEDREVVDVLRLWKGQIGKLRTAVTAASAVPSNAKLPHVPDIVEQMPVKSLKAVEGGFTAPHACALCGLKREERVGRVDVEVDDSFGEWWVQGMDMHLSCRNFWEEFERKLKSR